FKRAVETRGKPTVILVKTIKGYGLGKGAEGQNVAHQKKKMTDDERLECGHRFKIPLDDNAIKEAEFYLPPPDSPEISYLKQRREALGGYLPHRNPQCPSLQTPPLEIFKDFLGGTGERAISTTMAMVRMLARLLRDENIGKYIVPIVPDEARTFGMDGLFRQAGIYASEGQQYRPVDADTLAPYTERQDGQILQAGICEAGAMASFLAAGTAYATHGVPTIPFYIYYSIFGFQRVGDLIWSCGDMLCRGFLLGGTSGRTTLNGEGLQHQDGHSQIVAGTVPNLISYDPAFAYELAVIVREGIRRMYEQQEDVFYYLTVTNENYVMPSMPQDSETGILKGMYRFRSADPAIDNTHKVHLLGSGAIMQQVLEAQNELAERGISADVWSVTSYTELHRDALEAERQQRLHPATPHKPWLNEVLENEKGVFVAASDYMRILPDSIAQWLPGPLYALGTDGFGLSETREALRDHFEVSTKHIVSAALHLLKQENGLVDN
ncbi:MAG: pyruvate dehydrogenase (acetyl-transferring), homodimeric type, partial [Pseudomonadota bacterium]